MLNYQSVVDRIESFSNHSPNVTLQTVARIAELPIFFLQVLSANFGQSMPKILISAGIHGDEPAGVEAILTFLEQHLPRWRDQFHFDVFGLKLSKYCKQFSIPSLIISSLNV